MRRRPVRYDRMADRTPENDVRPMLDTMRREIENLVKTMPAHHDYMVGLVRYIRQNQK